ncbi:MAG: tRNA preQ1(34) S-adenosylmethionine ribosyltransferase-isomerase QueA, partial [Patescibacteria group bacterium]|nr:tRNA preQ1(34) S-adenosylmethionine ribosyltransferase-isomerase QueA [Patescibacteria group bacterium]
MDFKNAFDYDLPDERIANEPLAKRDTSNLLIINRKTGEIIHKHFFDLAQLLGPNDVLVLNQSKVFPARLYGKKSTGGQVEILLISQQTQNIWKAISKPGLPVGGQLIFSEEISGKVIDKNAQGEMVIAFTHPFQTFFEALDHIGSTPIPGYIHTKLSETQLRKKYQTVYAKEEGSAAAPTAGLHFTTELLEKLKQKGVQIEYITLHVGLGTFQGLREEHFKTNSLHQEYYEVTEDVAKRLTQAKKEKKRIIAVGTTTTRTLETVATEDGVIPPSQGSTTLFMYPPFQFSFVESMITNFHLPKSSLLMLISAFGAFPNTGNVFSGFADSFLGKAYKQAIERNYRFFS